MQTDKTRRLRWFPVSMRRRWIRAKFCKPCLRCQRLVRVGDVAYYLPDRRGVLCAKCADQATWR